MNRIQNLLTKEIIEPEDRLTYALNRCGTGLLRRLFLSF